MAEAELFKWFLALLGAVGLWLLRSYFAGLKESGKSSIAHLEKSIVEMRHSFEVNLGRVEGKIDAINGRVGKNSETVSALSRQVDNNQADIKSLFRADDEIRKELRGL